MTENPISVVSSSIIKTDKHQFKIGELFFCEAELREAMNDSEFDISTEEKICEYYEEDMPNSCCESACVTDCYVQYRRFVELPVEDILTRSEWRLLVSDRYNFPIFLHSNDEDYEDKHTLLNKISDDAKEWFRRLGE